MSVTSEIDGRAASMARRRALSAGKSALVPQNGAASAPAPAQVAPAPTPSPAPATPSYAATSASARDIARARRAALSRVGRGNAPAAPPTRIPKKFATDGAAAPAVPVANASTSTITPPPPSNGQKLTASRVAPGLQVTGIDDVRFGSGLAARGTSPKVGFTRTNGGLIVSGSLVRSKIRVTGDEAGESIVVTGEADQRLDDDLTQRQPAPPPPISRAANPHGASVFSRRAQRAPSIETSQAGLPVTGTALGTSSRVTGDEALVRSAVTGNQYVAPERSKTVGTDTRLDPVTGSKVSVGVSHGLQRITGISVEADPRVTGDDAPVCTCITGSQYSASPDAPAPQRERGFSVRSPHHAAQQRSGSAPAITGSFANGADKVTGNHEFIFRPRNQEGDAKAGRLRLTGEGGTGGAHITGSAWGEQSNVTGTEGATAGSRNPSERAGKPQAFAGARRFAERASQEEPKHLVTGMSGYSSDSGARVTLSGGAQG